MPRPIPAFNETYAEHFRRSRVDHLLEARATGALPQLGAATLEGATFEAEAIARTLKKTERTSIGGSFNAEGKLLSKESFCARELDEEAERILIEPVQAFIEALEEHGLEIAGYKRTAKPAIRAIFKRDRNRSTRKAHIDRLPYFDNSCTGEPGLSFIRAIAGTKAGTIFPSEPIPAHWLPGENEGYLTTESGRDPVLSGLLQYQQAKPEQFTLFCEGTQAHLAPETTISDNPDEEPDPRFIMQISAAIIAEKNKFTQYYVL